MEHFLKIGLCLLFAVALCGCDVEKPEELEELEELKKKQVQLQETPEERLVRLEKEMEAAAAEVGKGPVKPDIETERTVCFCSKEFSPTSATTREEDEVARKELLKVTIIRAEQWIRQNPDRNALMQINEWWEGSRYSCKVILFVDPAPPPLPEKPE